MSLWTVAGCPSEDLVAAFVSGDLEPAEHEALEAHLDDCQACRGVVAECVRMFAGTNPATLPSNPSVSAEHPDAEPGSLEIGAAVGRYRIIEVLGLGGMGVVYLAHDPELDRRVALKVIRRREGDAAERDARLLKEARAMARLSHPNVIAVHDVGSWEGQVFVAMEFAGGGTLEQWLAASPRTWSRLAPTLMAAGWGLAAAHEAGLVHRDFKPDNVLLSERGRVFVTDFGLARWEADATTLDDATLRSDTDSLVLTHSGAFVGTPAYMAPEQFEGAKVGPACDQFAYCVVLWEALFGERPFRGAPSPPSRTRSARPPPRPFPAPRRSHAASGGCSSGGFASSLGSASSRCRPCSGPSHPAAAARHGCSPPASLRPRSRWGSGRCETH